MVIMKATTNNNCASDNVVESGRVTKIRHHPRSLENEEIQMYLSKLKDLVPFCPKNRKLSKLEVIQYVIDYICDLQTALDSHPAISAAAVAAAAANSVSATVSAPNSRQPLGVIPPNTIDTPVTTVAPVHVPEKVATPDSRPVSLC